MLLGHVLSRVVLALCLPLCHVFTCLCQHRATAVSTAVVGQRRNQTELTNSVNAPGPPGGGGGHKRVSLFQSVASLGLSFAVSVGECGLGGCPAAF